MRRIAVLALVFLLVPLSCVAATISGKVYDIELEEAMDVLVSINTVPEQTLLAKNGSYSFQVPSGTYVLEARRIVKSAITDSVRENLTVARDGVYTLDLILFPVVPELYDPALGDIDFNVSVDEPGARILVPWWAWVTIAIALLLIVLLSWRLSAKRDGSPAHPAPDHQLFNEEEMDLAAKVIKILEKEHGRINQKDLRKHLPYSEAKVSLVVSELESKGMIEKIKKGRGNILVLKR